MQNRIQQLRDAYDKIERVDPDQFAYKCLCAWLDLLRNEQLKILVDAKIKWVSSLSRNRLVARSVKPQGN